VRLPAIILATSATTALLLAAGREAAAACGDAAHWTSEAILPLALIRGSRVEPDRDQCPEPGGFHPDGVRWRAIDRWGRFVGVVENAHDSMRGTIFRLVSGTRGVGVFVRGPWSASTSAESAPEPALRAALERLLGKLGSKREVQFFRAQALGAPDAFAVVTTRASITVAYAEKKRWHVAFRESYGRRWTWPLYQVRAIVDMSGDGLPEIIYHFNEYEDGRGYEVVLAATRGRRYRQVSDNEDNGP
jgi:hypothetical protein